MEGHEGRFDIALPELELAKLELNFSSSWFRSVGAQGTVHWSLRSVTQQTEALETPLYKPRAYDPKSAHEAVFDSQARLSGLLWSPSAELWRNLAAPQRSSASASLQATFQVDEPLLGAALSEQESTSWQLDLWGPWQAPEVLSREGGLMALELTLKLREGARLSELSVYLDCETRPGQGRLFVDERIGSCWTALSVQDGSLGLTQPGLVKIDLSSASRDSERLLTLRFRVDPESARRSRRIRWLVLNGARARSNLVLRDLVLGRGDGLPGQSFELPSRPLAGARVEQEKFIVSGIDALRVNDQPADETPTLELEGPRITLNAPLPVGAELRCDLIFEPAQRRSIRSGTNLQSEVVDVQAKVLGPLDDPAKRSAFDEALRAFPPHRQRARPRPPASNVFSELRAERRQASRGGPLGP